MARQRLSDEAVEAMMVPKIVEAIYPVLIPMEQQDLAIQAKNHARMTEIATAVWRRFSKSAYDAAAAERERCAAIARKYVDLTNGDVAHSILREIERG